MTIYVAEKIGCGTKEKAIVLLEYLPVEERKKRYKGHCDRFESLAHVTLCRLVAVGLSFLSTEHWRSSVNKL